MANKAKEKEEVEAVEVVGEEAPKPVTNWTVTVVFENGTRIASPFEGSDKQAQKHAKEVGANGLENLGDDGVWTFYPSPKIAKVSVQPAVTI
jgi:hypothetical protein